MRYGKTSYSGLAWTLQVHILFKGINRPPHTNSTGVASEATAHHTRKNSVSRFGSSIMKSVKHIEESIQYQPVV
jgi:hypothetical protein